MKLRLVTLLLAATGFVTACDGGSGAMGAAGPAGPGGNPGPTGPAGPPGAQAQIELAALARSEMVQPDYALPRELNDLELAGNDNPSEFDDWFE